MKKTILLFSLCLLISACGGIPQNDDTPQDPTPTPIPSPAPIPPRQLGSLKNVSLDSKAHNNDYELPRDLSSENAIIKLKMGASWINNIRLNGKFLSFNVEENTSISTGHRFDTIEVIVRDIKIGSICVTQARPRKSSEKLQWTTSGKMYWEDDIPGANGREKTIFIYNLEKTTGGKDNYRNYPAFAYCIEMNHDPEKDMEWYLPADNDLPDIRQYPAFSDTYYWTASSLQSGGYKSAKVYKYNSAATSKKKNELMGVYAFRNGSGIE